MLTIPSSVQTTIISALLASINALGQESLQCLVLPSWTHETKPSHFTFSFWSQVIPLYKQQHQNLLRPQKGDTIPQSQHLWKNNIFSIAHHLGQTQ